MDFYLAKGTIPLQFWNSKAIYFRYVFTLKIKIMTTHLYVKFIE